MHITLLTDGIFPYVIGGMQKHSYCFAKYMARKGHRIALYHPKRADGADDYGKYFSEEELKNIRFFEIPFPVFGKTPGHYIRESYEFSRQLYRVYDKQPAPDFIYAKGFTGWEFVHQKQQGKALPPIGVNFHGYEMFQQAPDLMEAIKQRLLLRSPTRYIMTNADAVFSYGGKITTLLQQLGIPAKRIIEVPGGIESDWLASGIKATGNTIRFVFSGRNERRKGLKELYKAFESIAPRHWEFHFIGPLKEKRKQNFIYHGQVGSKDEMRKLLQGMDILVCPSISEGMPNVILEAMASGLAIIATDTGATSVMVSEKNGWLVEPGNVRELRGALEKALAAGGEELRRKKLHSLELVKEKFLWDRIAEMTTEKLEQFLA